MPQNRFMALWLYILLTLSVTLKGNIGQTRDEYCGARDYDVIRFRNRCQLIILWRLLKHH